MFAARGGLLDTPFPEITPSSRSKTHTVTPL